MSRIAIIFGVTLLIGCALVWSRAEEAKPAPIPPAATRKIDFKNDIAPMLAASCVQCHGNGKNKSDFSIDTREKLLEGGASGLAVEVGDSSKSLIIQLVSGQDPDRIMPNKGKRLTPEQIGLLRAWIDQGLEWPKEFTFKAKPAPLEPRKVVVPTAAPGSNLTNPIDLILQAYFSEHKIAPANLVDDRTFARRAYLDTIGLLPSPWDLESFINETRPDKRDQLVKKLLAEKHKYAGHWLTFWNDALRNDFKGTGYIDGGRKSITEWLYNALADNMAYDRFVRELVTGANGAEGFSKGIIWRGVVNSSQTPQMQAAQNISQVFMGVNLKCASCHDSFISDWKLADSYGLAGIYADKPLEMERCNRPLGQMAEMKFLYPSLGKIDASAPREKRIEQLAQIITSERNGRLSRTIVNRIWQKLMGRGFIEPTDEMDNASFSADLLDFLASDLAENHFDLKRTISLIMTSRAYQMPAVASPEDLKNNFVFAGPVVRRMSAEQFVDAVATVTGAWPQKAAVAAPDSPASTTKPMTRKDGIIELPAEALSPVRASLCLADPLTTALGRPNREQVTTVRGSAASTLQALEMTNGATLTKMLHRGAVACVKDQKAAADQVTTQFYLKALGRAPSAAEMTSACEMVGAPVKPEGVEDLLWAIVMLPEFQLIR